MTLDPSLAVQDSHGNIIVAAVDNNYNDPAGQVLNLDRTTGHTRWKAQAVGCSDLPGTRYLGCYAGTTLMTVDKNTGHTNSVRTDGKLLSMASDGTAIYILTTSTDHALHLAEVQAGDLRHTVWKRDINYATPVGLNGTLAIDPVSKIGSIDTGTDKRYFKTVTGEPSLPSDVGQGTTYRWSRDRVISIDPLTSNFTILNDRGSVIGSGYGDAQPPLPPMTTRSGNGYLGTILMGDSAYDATSGKKLWRSDALMPQGWTRAPGSFSKVAAIIGNTVIVRAKDQFVGLDLRSGKRLWRSSAGTGAANIIASKGNMVTVVGKNVVAVNVRDGKQQWTQPVAANSNIHNVDGNIVAINENTVSLLAAS